MKGNSRLLEYLLLDPEQRINYRVGRDISLKDLYHEWTGLYIPNREFGIAEAADALKLPEKAVRRAVLRGEVGNYRRVENGKIVLNPRDLERYGRGILKKIPVSELMDIVRSGKYYIDGTTFSFAFKEFYNSSRNGKSSFLTPSQAAKVVYELNKRKRVIEKWKTFEDLKRESGAQINANSVRVRYRDLIRRERNDIVRIKQLPKEGQSLTKWVYKISPPLFNKILKEERTRAENSHVGVKVSDLASLMNKSYASAINMIGIGVKKGLIHPLKSNRSATYFIPPAEAQSIVNNELVIPKRAEYEKESQKKLLLEVKCNGPLIIDDVFKVNSAVEMELWERVRSGDQRAFEMLLGLYSPVFERAFGSRLYGNYAEERRVAFQSALFEIVAQNQKPKKRFDRQGFVKRVFTLANRRVKEDRPSWLSLDRRMTNGRYDSDYCLLDGIPDKKSI